MIVSFSRFSPEYQRQFAKFMSVRPIPQLPAWTDFASMFYEKGAILEAYYIFDRLTAVYGKKTARVALERFSGVPMYMCGRGLPCDFGADIHPLRYLLRDRMMPLSVGGHILLRNGANVVAFSPNSLTSRTVHLFSPRPTHTGFSRLDDDGRPVDWIALGSTIAYSSQSESVILADLSQIDPGMSLEIANKTPLLTAELTFDAPVRHLCGPLSDGTFFVTLASPIPILSDECRLCAVDTAKIRAFQREYPMLPCNVREIGALKSEIVLTNTEQTLNGDCVAAQTAFVTCGGGMQSREVRFIASDGSWKTRFIHENSVIAVISTPRGPVSLDESGQAFLWRNGTPVDDRHFALDAVEGGLGDDPADRVWSLDWQNGRLYLTRFDRHSDDFFGGLSSFCITDSGAHIDFITHVAGGLVFLADSGVHFWNDALGMIEPAWQLPGGMASADDWRDLLKKKSPSVEEDPRIRMIE